MQVRLFVAVWLAVLLHASMVRVAAPDESHMIVAVCLPGTPLGSAEERSQLAKDLAAAIEAKVGGTVEGRVYARVEDLERESGELSFVLVESVEAVTAHLRPVAVGVVGGDSRVRLALYGKSGTSLKALSGKRLIYPRIGRGATPAIDNLLFGGEPVSASLVRQAVPDVVSGAKLVSLDEADFLLAYSGQGQGLLLLLESPPIPGITLALGGASGAAALAPAVLQAVAPFSVGSIGVQGFQAAAAGEYQALAGGLAAAPRKVPLFPVPTLVLRGTRITLPTLVLPRPTLDSYLVAPTQTPPLEPRGWDDDPSLGAPPAKPGAP